MTLSAIKPALFLLISFGVVLYSPSNISAKCIAGDCENGLGTYFWPNGDKYTGEWKNGKRNGHGSFIWPEGDRFVGEWTNDTNNGDGSYIYPDMEKQQVVEYTKTEVEGVGCIRGDCVNGLGTYTWLSGAKYVGDFENGKRNGLGLYSFPGGQRILGIWENGRYVGKENPRKSQWGG